MLGCTGVPTALLPTDSFREHVSTKIKNKNKINKITYGALREAVSVLSALVSVMAWRQGFTLRTRDRALHGPHMHRVRGVHMHRVHMHMVHMAIRSSGCSVH